MRTLSVASVLIALASLALATSPLKSAPAAGLDGLAALAQASATNVEYEICRQVGGAEVCSLLEDDDEEDDDEDEEDEDDDDSLPVGSRPAADFAVGSSQWWQAMDRDARGAIGRR